MQTDSLELQIPGANANVMSSEKFRASNYLHVNTFGGKKLEISIDITDTTFYRCYTYRYFVAYQVVDKDHM